MQVPVLIEAALLNTSTPYFIQVADYGFTMDEKNTFFHSNPKIGDSALLTLSGTWGRFIKVDNLTLVNNCQLLS